MEHTKRFPLLFWQETDQFNELFIKEKDRLQTANKNWFAAGGDCTYSGTLQCSENGTFEFWLNDNGRQRVRESLNAEQAVLYAIKHGTTGWWPIGALEELILGKGDLFERAMWEGGFRRHKKKPSEWARRNKNDKWISKREETIYHSIANNSEEGKHLQNIITIPNATFHYGSTMSFVVGTNGMIHGHLNVNPFGGTTCESMPAWMAGFNVRGHIYNKQDGFLIIARNIMIGEEKYIHITTSGTAGVSECVWPTIIDRNHVKNIAEHLKTGEELTLVV